VAGNQSSQVIELIDVFRGIMAERKYQNLREGVIALVVLIVVSIVVYALQPQ
jgi:hypothetical protein